MGSCRGRWPPATAGLRSASPQDGERGRKEYERGLGLAATLSWTVEQLREEGYWIEYEEGLRGERLPAKVGIALFRGRTGGTAQRAQARAGPSSSHRVVASGVRSG